MSYSHAEAMSLAAHPVLLDLATANAEIARLREEVYELRRAIVAQREVNVLLRRQIQRLRTG